MGPYTELNCAFSLRSDTPEEVIDTLLFMTGQHDQEPQQLPAHAFFETVRWRQMLNRVSPEFDEETCCNAAVELSETSGRHRVTIRCDFRDYDIEILRFISWITPFIFADKGDVVGYTRSPDLEPITVLYYPNRTLTRQPAFEKWGEDQ